MSKDPAILFYTSDFLTGTLTMTDEQIGKYIKLLCLQHQKGGYLTEKDMSNICKTYDEDIFKKFKKNGEYFFNERMLNEIKKRKSYSESRSKNRTGKGKKKKNISKSYVKHMENENINENINVFENIRKLYPGTKRGLQTEFNNFKKKHKDWKEVLSLLKNAIDNQIEWRKRRKVNKQFIPEWKNFQTWINQRCWEDELIEEIEEKKETEKYPSIRKSEERTNKTLSIKDIVIKTQ